jgi:hypothetical protein
MEADRSQFVVKWLPSLADFAFLAPIAFLFGRMEGVKTLLGDGDTGWHIRTGEWIMANHVVPTHDVFSFAKPGGEWFAWEWLSDVVFSGLNSLGGLRAVVLLSVLLLCTTFSLVFWLVRTKTNPVAAILITLIAAAASSVHWLARPHLFTMLFLALFLNILERARAGQGALNRNRNLAYWVLLPVLTIVWTNLHGGFIVGIVLVGGYGTGELLKALLAVNRETRRPAAQSALRYFLCAAICLTASLVNPYTWRLHVHLFQFLRDPYAAQHIVEFFSLSFHHPVAIFFEGMLLAAAVSAFWYASRGCFVEFVQLLMWAHAGLLAARNIPIFMIVAAPLVGAAVQHLLDRLPTLEVAEWLRGAAAKFNAGAARLAETDSLPRWHVVSLAGIALVAALLFAPAPPQRFRAEYDPKSYPARAIEVLRAMPPARIFTSDVWGDYLIWRLYPRTKVFVDGRSDYYGANFENKYIDVLNVKYDWEKTLAGFDVDTILLPTSAPLAGALKESRRWHVAYDDGVALIFRPCTRLACPADPSPYAATRSSCVTGRSLGPQTFVAANGDGAGRDREATKTEARDQAITLTMSNC